MQIAHSIQPIVMALIGAPIVLGMIGVAGAQVMESASYQIQSDSVNLGGGNSTSSSYILESTGGEVATGDSESAGYRLRAGYQQMQEVYIAMTTANDVTMAPAIGGVSGGTSNGSTSVSVITDSAAGYQLLITAAEEPAMQSASGTIADYVPTGGAPDFAFTTNAGDAHFGFAPYGDDVVQSFQDNGAVCNAGSNSTAAACWDGLATTSAEIAASAAANHPTGATTTVYFRVGIGGSVNQGAGTYVATTTLTALPL